MSEPKITDIKPGPGQGPAPIAGKKIKLPGRVKFKMTREVKYLSPKTIIARFKNGTIKPSDVYILKVQDIVNKETTGRVFLSEIERDLINKWTPKTQDEAIEYERYRDGWKTIGFAELDAKTCYLSAIIELLKTERVVARGRSVDVIEVVNGFKIETGLAQLALDKKEIDESIKTFTGYYKRLLMFSKLFSILAQVYQADIDIKVKKWITELKAQANAFDEGQRAREAKRPGVFARHLLYGDIFLEKFINLESIKEKDITIELAYIQEFKKYFAPELGQGWQYGI